MKKVLLLSPHAMHLKRQQAMCLGIQAHGYEVVAFHNRKRGDTFEFGICSGARNSSITGRTFCRDAGLPVLFVELGYLKRAANNGDEAGFFQLGWGRLGAIPAGPVPADRWEALEIPLMPVKPVKPLSPILVAGQVGYDAQHNLSSHELGVWLCKSLHGLLARRSPRPKIIYRPHPLQATTWHCDIFHTPQNPRTVKLADALDQAGLVLTYNSTTGVEALLRGVGVVSHPSAHYHEAGKLDQGDRRLEYLHRLAYAQWRLPELEDGTGVGFALANRPCNTGGAGVI